MRRLLIGAMLGVSVAGCARPSDFELEQETPDATGCGDAFCESGLRVAPVTTVFTPGAYTLAVTADGVESACDFVIGGPAYQTFEPARPDCEPVCETASAQLDIP